MLDHLLPEIPRANERQRWSNIQSCSLALSAAELARRASAPLIVVCANNSAVQRLEEEVSFFAGDLPVRAFPDWETLPYDSFSPHQDIISDRLKTLNQLVRMQRGILIVAMSTLLQRIAPTDYLQARSFQLAVGQRWQLENERTILERAGYRCVDTVYEHGEFAVRGAVVDIFPMGSSSPIRIDLFDDEIESLRSFDVETQRTVDKHNEIDILPAREFPLDPQGIKLFRDSWHKYFDVDHRKCNVYQTVVKGITPPGIEYFLPLFFESTASLMDYIRHDCLLLLDAELDQSATLYWQEIRERYNELGIDPCNPLLPPEQLFFRAEDLFARFQQHPRIVFSPTDNKQSGFVFPCALPSQYPIDARLTQPLQHLLARLQSSQQRSLICAESSGRREALLELLHKANLRPQVVDSWDEFITGTESLAITVGGLEHGLQLPTIEIEIIAEAQLFGQRVMQRRRRKSTSESNELGIKSLLELSEGAPVVHSEHGVGRYIGMQTLEIDGQSAEFLTLLYADDAKLYVPVGSLELISRYSGSDDEHAPLHRLGSEQWEKARRKAAEKVRDVAAELLDIYAKRAARKGTVCEYSELNYQQFSAAFPFEETPDQAEAISAVEQDMRAATPMDRLVCGDVGFGKTEVAMRAAFLAVDGGRQVAMLVPTTLLAQQHYETFRDRFSDWPVSIEVVSRFRSDAELADIKQRLQQGKIDILVGTHKLLQSDVKFADLGLLIIDEEHRFGVRQKEAIKALRAEVDILTLTATPIPRTLNMAMAGMRDLSVIATPPARRLSVKTFVSEKKPALIKEAMMREIMRGGQIYYLHNEVKTIENAARDLQELLPEARIGIGHGQMRERALEQVMSDFYHKRYNVLLCTTIIETGIDVPNANTIIIERSDKFGLAQLHQLRGRVGRSHHQAYAYLLTPNHKAMTADAHKRLEAIAQAEDLGAGFTLASHDMEIRGAGELLGDEQSGQIESVGLSMYMDMLDRAVKALKQGKSIDWQDTLKSGPEVNFRIPALIPDDYLPDVNMRLNLYKRIAAAHDAEQLRDLQVEMIDRFGLLPEPCKTLFEVSLYKQTCSQLGIAKFELNATGGLIEFNADTKVQPITVVKLLQNHGDRYRMEGANKLRIKQTSQSSADRLKLAAQVLAALAA